MMMIKLIMMMMMMMVSLFLNTCHCVTLLAATYVPICDGLGHTPVAVLLRLYVYTEPNSTTQNVKVTDQF